MRAMGKGFKVKENSLHYGLRQGLEQKGRPHHVDLKKSIGTVTVNYRSGSSLSSM
jgi:hypothetical protein